MNKLKKLVNRFSPRTRDITRAVVLIIAALAAQFGLFMLLDYFGIKHEFFARVTGAFMAGTIYGGIHWVVYYIEKRY